MVKYRKTKKRLFSKLKKNRSRKNRSRKNKKRMGGTPTPPNQSKKESTKGETQLAKMLEERRKRDKEIRERLKEENLNQRRVSNSVAPSAEERVLAQTQPQTLYQPPGSRRRAPTQGIQGPPQQGTPGTYTPIVELNQNGQRVFRCPVCNRVSGTAAPRNPQNLYYSQFHSPDCVNTGRVPVER